MPNCAALSCRNTFGKGYRMFRFPSKVRDRERHDQWIRNMNRPEGWEPAASARLCHIHFEPDQFECRREDGLTKLKPNALPTLFDYSTPFINIEQPSEEKHARTEGKSKISSAVANKKMDHMYYLTNKQLDKNEIQLIPVVPVAMYTYVSPKTTIESTENVIEEVELPAEASLSSECILFDEVNENLGDDYNVACYEVIEDNQENRINNENIDYVQEIQDAPQIDTDLETKNTNEDVLVNEPKTNVEDVHLEEPDKVKRLKRTATFTWDAHAHKLTSGLWNYFQKHFETDFEISSRNSTARVHQLILSIFCPISKIATKRRVRLNIDEIDLNVLVEFLYCGKVDIPYERMPSVMVAARQLGFTALANMIEKFIVVTAHTKSKKQEATKTAPKLKTRSKFTQTSITTDAEKDKQINRKKSAKKVEAQVSENSSSPAERDPKKLKKQVYTCNVCAKVFKCRVQYFKHGKEHLNPDQLAKCKYCPYTSKSELGLAAHVGIKHKDVAKSKIYSCTQCKYVCRKNFYLKMHMENSHGSNVFLCEKCPYTCKSRIVLKNHFRVYHSDAKPFKCDKCDYRSKTKTGLKYHEEKHQDKVMCDICGLRLKMSTMRKHKDIHKGKTKRFTCNSCSFGTRDRTNLRVHLKNVHGLSEDEAQKIILTNFPYVSSNVEVRSLSVAFLDENILEMDSEETSIALQLIA